MRRTKAVVKCLHSSTCGLFVDRFRNDISMPRKRKDDECSEVDGGEKRKLITLFESKRETFFYDNNNNLKTKQTNKLKTRTNKQTKEEKTYHHIDVTCKCFCHSFNNSTCSAVSSEIPIKSTHTAWKQPAASGIKTTKQSESASWPRNPRVPPIRDFNPRVPPIRDFNLTSHFINDLQNIMTAKPILFVQVYTIIHTQRICAVTKSPVYP